MLAHSFLIKSSSKLLVTRTGIKARMSLISGLWFPWPIYMFLKWDLTLAHWTQVSDRCPLGYLFIIIDHRNNTRCTSESSLSAWRNIGPLTTYWAHREDSDQTEWMPRLIWIFAGHTSFSWFCHAVAHMLDECKTLDVVASAVACCLRWCGICCSLLP